MKARCPYCWQVWKEHTDAQRNHCMRVMFVVLLPITAIRLTILRVWKAVSEGRKTGGRKK